MFDEIGKKIKGLATFFCISGIIISLISGTVLLATENLIGIAVIALGSLLSWIGSFALYGFGDLIESSRGTYELLKLYNNAGSRTNKPINNQAVAPQAVSAPIKQSPTNEASMSELRELYGRGKITYDEYMERRSRLLAENNKTK